VEEKRLIPEAEINPYKALNPKRLKYPRSLPIEVWERHLTATLQERDTPPLHIHSSNTGILMEPALFTTQEISEVVNNLKNKKACSPDSIYSEHLKASLPILQGAISCLLNECLRQGSIPNSWRKSTVKMLCKGKGSTADPNAYRGIAMECTLMKTLTTLLCIRLMTLVDRKIPEQQFGFRRGRATTQAVQCL
jgi:hypothetical protein